MASWASKNEIEKENEEIFLYSLNIQKYFNFFYQYYNTRSLVYKFYWKKKGWPWHMESVLIYKYILILEE